MSLNNKYNNSYILIAQPIPKYMIYNVFDPVTESASESDEIDE